MPNVCYTLPFFVSENILEKVCIFKKALYICIVKQLKQNK